MLCYSDERSKTGEVKAETKQISYRWNSYAAQDHQVINQYYLRLDAPFPFTRTPFRETYRRRWIIFVESNSKLQC